MTGLRVLEAEDEKSSIASENRLSPAKRERK